ncbi:hypothetical protein TNIN_412291 [Trichonephila inaurata madagascariensis]|uniref:Uncharacterized protein n=1 Tax=Trichonephila inaurata madagascariensis TaxID=2747483 RepID=A0A8X6YZS5_9ARAC|nr:hypothetical protein TNIN_412291 [Trichonephila inaurata madagascariensis]
MLSLEERIALISCKMGGKTYKEKVPAVEAKIRKTITNKDQYQATYKQIQRLTGYVENGKPPKQPSTSDDTIKRLCSQITWHWPLLLAVFRLTVDTPFNMFYHPVFRK